MSPSATTPGACTCTWGCGEPTGRSPSATGCASCCRCSWRSRPTRRSSTAVTPASPRSAARPSPAPSRAAACRRRSATGTATRASSPCSSAPARSSSRPSSGGACEPHHSFGTVEVRICDAQTRGEESTALAGLIAACIAQTAFDYDEHGYEGAGAAPLGDREIEENLWRAIRHGAGGRMIDFRVGEEIETRALVERILAWTAPARGRLGIDVALPARKRGRAGAGGAGRRGDPRGRLPGRPWPRPGGPTPASVNGPRALGADARPRTSRPDRRASPPALYIHSRRQIHREERDLTSFLREYGVVVGVGLRRRRCRLRASNHPTSAGEVARQ